MRYVIVQNDAHHSLEVLLGLVCAAAMIYSLVTGKPVNVGNPGHEQRRGNAARKAIGGRPQAYDAHSGPVQANEAARGRLGTRGH